MPSQNQKRNPAPITSTPLYTAVVLLAGLWLFACSAEPGHLPGADFGLPVNTRDPAILASLITSSRDPDSTRESADRILAQVRGPADPLRLHALTQVIADPAQSDDMRIYALHQLAAARTSAAVAALAEALPAMNGDVLRDACTLAGQLADPALIPPLYESLDTPEGNPDGNAGSAPAKIRASPQWTAISKIASETPEKSLLAAIIPPSGAALPPAAARSAALDLLENITPRPALLAQLSTADHPDRWLAAVQEYARRFQTLPVGTMENRWIALLQKPENAATLDRATAAAQALQTQPDFLAAPRFIGTLAVCDDATIALPRMQLLADFTTGPLRLNAYAHLHRSPSSSGALDDVDNTLAANEPRLSRGDLLALRLIARALANPSTLQEFARQGAADLADTATEHGGLLSIDPGTVPAGASPIPLRITNYTPLYAANNAEYVASDALLDAAPTGIALFQFHCQQVSTAEVAGPGLGDLEFARRFHVNCLVITSISGHQLDFQFYTPNIAVIDLGVRTIPK